MFFIIATAAAKTNEPSDETGLLEPNTGNEDASSQKEHADQKNDELSNSASEEPATEEVKTETATTVEEEPKTDIPRTEDSKVIDVDLSKRQETSVTNVEPEQEKSEAQPQYDDALKKPTSVPNAADRPATDGDDTTRETEPQKKLLVHNNEESNSEGNANNSETDALNTPDNETDKEKAPAEEPEPAESSYFTCFNTFKFW